jgi:hypothetical protein
LLTVQRSAEDDGIPRGDKNRNLHIFKPTVLSLFVGMLESHALKWEMNFTQSAV